MTGKVHVFHGYFESQETALRYVEPQWEPEPDEDISEKTYIEWEERNPSWQMRDELEIIYLDSDFIEAIGGDTRFEYLAGLLVEPDALQRIQALADDTHNFLVLNFDSALGGFEAEVKSTPHLNYCGLFDWKY